jgi:hypothetical protein
MSGMLRSDGKLLHRNLPEIEKGVGNRIACYQIPARKKSPEFFIDGSGSGDKNRRRRCFSSDDFSFI